MRVTWLFFLLGLCSEVKQGFSRKAQKIFDNRPLYMRALYAGVCEKDPGDTSANVTIDYVGPKFFVNGIVDIYRQMDKAESTSVTIRTCQSPALEKNCETFQTWRFGQETCALVEQKNLLWSPLFYAFHPRLKCPVLKTRYTLTNATIDPTAVVNIFGAALLEKYFWRVRIDVRDYKLFAGICFGLSFLRGKH